MESLSRPPHRRKHSTTTNGFSYKNPYDGVLRSNGGERKALEAHEYTEIFSGACAIPVLDLSGLEEKAGSGDLRSSKLDYSNIFGGLRNDDVAVPYEELFNGSAKKSKPRMPADTFSPLQESGSRHPSGKIKRSSGDASDQSVDGVKQQFNVSFNRTSQRNNDASDGKTHIAQLHAVPGFAYFVDGTPQLPKTETRTENDRHVPSLKREVSRTWSFSAEVEAVKGKGGLSNEKLHTTDKLQNVSDANLNSHFLRTPPPSSYPSYISENKDPRKTSTSSFASKEDVSEKTAGESSPPFFGEEFDENSVAAVSAAALKKAIDQAQESIRIAKMIMEKKKEGFQDGSKLGPGKLKVFEKESKRNSKACGPKENNAREKCKEANTSNPVFTLFTENDAKSNPSLHRNDILVNAANVDMGRVWENVGAAKENGEAFAEGDKLFASDCSRSKTLYIDEKVEVEQLEEFVDAPETHTEATDFPGLADNAERRTMNLESVELDNNNSLMLSTGKHKFHLGGIESGEETFGLGEVTLYNRKEFDFVAEKVEKALSTSQRMQGVEKSVEEAGKCQATSDHAEWPENRVERVLNTSQGAKQEKVVDEAGEKLRICHEDEVSKDRENDVDDKGECEKEFEDCEEVVDVELLTVMSSEFDKFLDESFNLVMNGNLEQEEVEKKSENVFELKENRHRQGKTSDEENKGVMQEEAHMWFESEEQLTEALEEEINETGSHAFPDIDDAEKKVNEAHEPEIDVKKQNHGHDEDEPNSPREVEQNEVVERGKNSSEHEAAETIVMETNNYVEDEPNLPREVEQNKVEESGKNSSEHAAAETTVIEANNYAETEKSSFWNSGELNNTLRSEFQETASEDIDEAVDADSADSSTIFNDAHTNDTNPISCGTPEACDISSKNKSEEYQEVVKSFKENDAVPEVIGAFAEVGKEETGNPFHLQDNEMPGMGSLHRSASEEVLAESMQKTFEDLSSDVKMENAGIVDADTGKKLPEDDDAFKTSKIHEAAQEYDVKINWQNSPEVHASDNGIAESDGADVGEVLQQTSETDEGSVSTSTLENKDGLSAHESEEFTEHSQEKTSNKEGLVDELEKVSNERKYKVEPTEEFISQLHTEHKETEKSSEIERVAERGFNMEKNKENLAGTSPMGEKDAKQGLQDFDKNDHQQRIEAIKRGREREKDRMAVERAIREARERAFAEARERAERAAVERAAAEVRQRVLAEAREKFEKSSVKQPVDKATTEAKLRAERAAVERATAEARERALEKAMSQKSFTETRTQTDRHPTDRSSGSSSSSRNNGMKHSLSSSDLENGMNTESAQRRKARLERHQRIMERAAKALEEKNMRDMLAQKEQAERNRLAEFLDADIKRWAAGKEGNLRALLSTLQYILGTNSGWQPISLTEIITTAAVKKAYRKATLYVHPDKLQQRGASIQQKYICEKVFDLLKAAWNRFNSDER